MSRRGIGTLVVLVALGLLATGAGAAALRPPKTPAAEPLPSKPLVLVGPLSPLTVRGLRFEAWERVTVTLDGGRRGTVRVVANRAGAFRAEFELAGVLRACRTVTIRAVGSRGSTAVRQLPRPNCREP
jgi:hypothetical protein